MKHVFKFTRTLFLASLLLIASCSNDDDATAVVINLQDVEVTINENPTNGDVIGTVQSNSSSSLNFSITTQTPAGALAINTNTGELTVADATLFDYETNPSITAIVAATGAENTANVTITVNNVNELSLQDFSVTIDENPSNGAILGTVQAIGDGTLSYSITSQTPAGALAIDTSTGELTVADAMLFDYETNPTLTATIAVDNSGNTQNLTATITLNNVNELIAQDFAITIDENPSNGAVLGTVQATGDGTLSYSITSQTPAGAIAINANTGELTVVDATLFDFETNPTINAVVDVTNSVSTEDITVTINLNDLNEPASIGDYRDGGIVFWVDPTDNNHGLVVAVSSQFYSGTWGCSGTSTGATGTAIGTGVTNTAAIVSSGCATSGSVVEIISNLNLNGYDDWFLPSQDELMEMYNNITVVNAAITANGGQVTYQFHWSSTEINTTAATLVNLTTGTVGGSGKDGNIYFAKPVRAF